MNNNPQESICKTITFEQFKQAMSGQELQGTPACTAHPVPQRESASGQELLKQRIRVSFDFDVVCNDRPIRDASDDDEAKQYDLALLKSFLVADKEKLLHMMVDAIGAQLGLDAPESFVAAFFPQINTESWWLLHKAIDALPGDHGAYWQDVAQAPEFNGIEDYLALFTEEIFACFSAKFVNSSFEVIGDDQ